MHSLRSDTLLARIYPRGGRHPDSWHDLRFAGPLPSGRFDHHVAGERRGVLYLGTNLITCIAEVFQGSRVLDRIADDRFIAAFRTAEALQLLDLVHDWPTRAGASQSLSSGPRPRAQAWARAIYDAYPDVQGLMYPSSMHGGQPAFVLWERGEAALPAVADLDIPLSHPGLLPDLVRAASTLGYLLR
jgi:RES domain-containing protein